MEVDKTIDDFVHIIITVLGSPSGWRPSLETSPEALVVVLKFCVMLLTAFL